MEKARVTSPAKAYGEMLAGHNGMNPKGVHCLGCGTVLGEPTGDWADAAEMMHRHQWEVLLGKGMAVLQAKTLLGAADDWETMTLDEMIAIRRRHGGAYDDDLVAAVWLRLRAEEIMRASEKTGEDDDEDGV